MNKKTNDIVFPVSSEDNTFASSQPTMNRRSFLRRVGCTGALIATSQLPVWGEDDPSVFPDRGGYERLSMSYAMVEIGEGLERPFSVLHMSDSHLTAAYPHENDKKQTLCKNRTKTFGGRQEEALRDALAWARDHVDYIVHTGDLIDWQSEANFDLVRKYFGESVVGCMGNHEFTTDMWLSDPKEERTEAYKDNTRRLLQSIYPWNVELASQVVCGVNFVTLDDVYGYVTERQVALFEEEIKKGLPIVLCMHVPFFTDKLWLMTKRFWSGEAKRFTDGTVPPPDGDYLAQKEDPVTSAFIARLRKEPLLKAILAGHEHITMQDRFSDTAEEFVVAGGFLFHAREVLFV